MLRRAVLYVVLAGCGGSGAQTPPPSDAPGVIADAVDAADPVMFLNVRVEDIGSYRAVVRFETSRETSCHIEFGNAPDTLDRMATDPDMKPGEYRVVHEVPIEDLEPDAHFYFQAVVTDPANVTFRSDAGEFTTGAGVPLDLLANVALASAGTTVTDVSSNYGLAANDEAWGANHAIDGQMATEWSSNMDGDSLFIELDLGQQRSVKYIGFRSRQMSDGTSIVRSFQLLIDGVTTLGPYETPDPDVRYVIELPAPTTMQTVRMTAAETTGGNTGLKELQLFSPP